MTAWMWLLVVSAGAALLGYFIFYGQRRTEEPEPIAAKARRDEATRVTYEQSERDEAR